VALVATGIRTTYVKDHPALTDIDDSLVWLLLCLQLSGGLPRRTLTDPMVECFA